MTLSLDLFSFIEFKVCLKRMLTQYHENHQAPYSAAFLSL